MRPQITLTSGMDKITDASPLTRRRFLQTSALAAAAPLGFPAITRCASPNGKLHHASIGVGGMGFNDLNNFLSHGNTEVVAICDVDANHLNRAAQSAPGARKYRDWRELIATEGDKIDSINVAVPDHMHAPIAMAAIRAGKHVYCQKPMCHDVAEVRALTLAAEKAGVVTQLGTQHASGAGDRIAVDWLRSGVIGKVKRVVLTANRPGAVETYRLKGPRPEKGNPVPDSLAWDLWLGTAPAREFAQGIYHPTLWRAWLDFGTGWSGDIGCHIFDAVWKGLDMKKAAPKSVVARADDAWMNDPARRADTWSQASHITWVFPGTAGTEGTEFTVEWFDGAFLPPDEIRKLYPGLNYPAESAMFLGTEGALLLTHGSGPLLLPGDKFKGVVPSRPTPRNHYHHFAGACLGGEMCESHFAQSGPMTEAILLGTVAVRHAGSALEWDAENLRVTNFEPANAHVRRTYREGWSVEGLG